MEKKKLAYYPTSFPLEWMQDSESGIAESAKYLDQIIATAHPDILHFNQFCYGALECGTPKIVVAHSDVLSWWKSVHDDPFPQSPWFAWYRDVVSKGLERADTIIAPSRWMLDTLRENYGSTSQRVKVVHNGRNADLFVCEAIDIAQHDRLAEQARQAMAAGNENSVARHVAETQQLRARPFMAEERRRARHVRADGDRPDRQLIPRQQVSGKRQQQGEHQHDHADRPVELARRFI